MTGPDLRKTEVIHEKDGEAVVHETDERRHEQAEVMMRRAGRQLADDEAVAEVHFDSSIRQVCVPQRLLPLT